MAAERVGRFSGGSTVGNMGAGAADAVAGEGTATATTAVAAAVLLFLLSLQACRLFLSRSFFQALFIRLGA